MNSIKKPDPIPFRLTIGVTGHRTLENVEVLSEKIKSVIDRILEKFPETKNTSVLLRVLSPLAEGSDRLVAEEILKYDKAELKAILPLAVDDYVEDFQSEESKKEFETLLGKADYQYIINKKPLREINSDESISEIKKQAYEDTGRYIVNHSDVLISIWDEMPLQGKGGTASIVEYAKSKGCPVFNISPDPNGEIKFIKGNGFDNDLFKQIDKFNSFNPIDKIWLNYAEENSKIFFGNNGTNEQYIIPEVNKSVAEDLLLPYYTHSEIFAEKNQRWYHSIGLIVFWMSFLSVATVAYGEIFFDHIPKYIFIIELLFLLIISFLIFFSHKRATHRNYIENRILTEHLRTDIILIICGIRVSPPQYIRHIESSYAKNGWMILLLEHILSKVPLLSHDPASTLHIIKNYIRKVWINSQIEYHKRRKEKLRNKNEVLTSLGNLIFYLAIFIALIHIFVTIDSQNLDNVLIFAVLLLPALGATITAIKTHRDYKKILTDSTIILNELENLDYEFRKPLTQTRLKVLIERAEKIMRRESEEWLELLASKELEKAV